jgi:NADPH-dependent 2,4-dienoyl-CoA reductase/sulfur reductase-like enzyme
MSSDQTFVIVGASLAGGKAAETLRSEGFDGDVVLVSAEAERPYERPPLSKGYLSGSADRSAIYVHDEGWYAEHNVDLRLGVRATAIDRAAHTVTLDDSSTVSYTKLLLTTGSSVRRLPIDGADLDGIYTLRTVGDSDALRDAIKGGGRIVVVGAGWIGLETAAAAKGYGGDVTVIDPQPTPLYGVLGPELGEVFAANQRDHGVKLRLGAGVAGFSGSGRVDGVVIDGGETVPADMVIVGVGIKPATELAEAAGLTIDNGIVVDARLQTSDSDIYAAGDVANAYNPLYGRHIRVEHWANALNGGPAAARSMLGKGEDYDRVPYFFSDQFDLGMEYSGLALPGDYDDVVIRGNREGREFVSFWLAEGRVLAGMNVNVWDVTDPIQAMIRSGQPVDTARLADPNVPLDEVVPS